MNSKKLFSIFGLILIICSDLALISLIHDYANQNNVSILWETSSIASINILLFFPLLIRFCAWKNLKKLFPEIDLVKEGNVDIETIHTATQPGFGAVVLLVLFFTLFTTASVMCVNFIYSNEIFQDRPILFIISLKIAVGFLSILMMSGASILFVCIILGIQMILTKK